MHVCSTKFLVILCQTTGLHSHRFVFESTLTTMYVIIYFFSIFILRQLFYYRHEFHINSLQLVIYDNSDGLVFLLVCLIQYQLELTHHQSRPELNSGFTFGVHSGSTFQRFCPFRIYFGSALGLFWVCSELSFGAHFMH